VSHTPPPSYLRRAALGSSDFHANIAVGGSTRPGRVQVFNDDGIATIHMDADFNNGGLLQVLDETGAATIDFRGQGGTINVGKETELGGGGGDVNVRDDGGNIETSSGRGGTRAPIRVDNTRLACDARGGCCRLRARSAGSPPGWRSGEGTGSARYGSRT
jgi:hypothetical protein